MKQFYIQFSTPPSRAYNNPDCHEQPRNIGYTQFLAVTAALQFRQRDVKVIAHVVVDSCPSSQGLK